MSKQVKKRIGDLLLEVGILSAGQLEKALEIQKQTGEKIGEVLVNNGFVTQLDIIQVLEFQLGIPHVNLEKYNIDQAACLLIPESIARRHGLIPISHDKNTITVAMSDPLNVYAVDDVRIYSGLSVQPVIALSNEIDEAIDKYYSTQKALQAVEEFKKEQISSLKIHSEAANEQSTEEINNSPAVKLVNNIIEQAVRRRASDIHIEPFENHIKIRFRTDGQLFEVMQPEIEIMPAISARIKIIGGMNITEKRLPQDGRISVEINEKDLDLRVSILPTIFGEKIVIRIADKKALLVKKENLGFTEHEMYVFNEMLKKPHGILLVTGPTGSGKSTTLYTAISEINRPDINIITVEDPVECVIEGINQVQVNQKTGLTFSVGLRSILRQDPNVIMIGEIRDSETAEIAVRSAITGHLVLSTLHTNDAPGAVVRLIDMGIEPFLVSSSVAGVVSQRLIRRICESCKASYEAADEELTLLGMDAGSHVELHRGKGCPKCNGTGYSGRLPVFEMMAITKTHREYINKRCSEEEIRALSIANGMRSLRDSTIEKVIQGQTTVNEVVRIAYSD